MVKIHLFRSAKLYLDEYGADASIYAAMRVDALIEVRNVQGVAAWKPIMRAIEEMR